MKFSIKKPKNTAPGGSNPTPSLVPDITNQAIQLDYMRLIGGLQENTRLLREEVQEWREKFAAQNAEIEQLRLRLLRLEAEVNHKPPLTIIPKKS